MTRPTALLFTLLSAATASALLSPETASAAPVTTSARLSPGTAGALLSAVTADGYLSPGTGDPTVGAPRAAVRRLAAPAAGDLHAPAAIASEQPSLAPPGGPVSFTWPIDQAADDLVDRPTPHVASATGHARTVPAAALRRGVSLPISHPGAFLKLSAQSGQIDPASVTVIDPRGEVHTFAAGLRRVGSAESGAFTLDPALGVGLFTLRAEASAPVRLDVLERGSDLVLLAQAASDVVFRGDDLQVEARLLHRGRPVAAERVTARLLAPDGRAVARTLTRAADGSYRARLPVRGEPTGQPWTIELQADATVGGRPVRRTTTTAVAVSVPTARPTGEITLSHPGGGVRAELALEVASAGRYAVSAVLYGRNRDGVLQPIAVGQSADQLAPGRRSLTLEFDAATVDAADLRGPFELRDLRLVDQGRMFVLHRQAR